ncbi:MAG: hypothetical protein ABIH99_03105 [Candidatus Micrarchaeota archaeon]
MGENKKTVKMEATLGAVAAKERIMAKDAMKRACQAALAENPSNEKEVKRELVGALMWYGKTGDESEFVRVIEKYRGKMSAELKQSMKNTLGKINWNDLVDLVVDVGRANIYKSKPIKAR